MDSVSTGGSESVGSETVEEPLVGLPDRIDAALAERPLGGPVVIAAVGAGLFVVSVLLFFRNLDQLGFSWAQAGALVFGTWLASLVVYAALYIAESSFSPRQRWKIATATVLGFVFVSLMVFLAVFVRTTAGVQMIQPTLPLLASAETGAIAGFLIGLLYVQARADARQARQVGQQLEFMHSILRHDVLNSMTVVRARAEYLDSHLEDYDDSVEAIENQAESVIDLSQRARAMVDAVATEADVEPEPVDLSTILTEEIDTVRASYDNLRLTGTVPDDVYVQADEMLAEVFGNLLGNAVQHNDAETPRIWVSVDTDEETVTVRIADNGPGIADDRKPTVFERGESTSGGGFGLYFVRTMVDHYGGEVRIEDRTKRRPGDNGTGPGGAVFVVELRRAEKPATTTVAGIEI